MCQALKGNDMLKLTLNPDNTSGPLWLVYVIPATSTTLEVTLFLAEVL